MTLLHSSHSTHGMNIVVKNCFLKNYKLDIVGRKRTYEFRKHIGYLEETRDKRDYLIIENTKLIGEKGSEMHISIMNSFAKFINVSVSQADQSIPVVIATNQTLLLLDSCEISDNKVVPKYQSKFAVLSVRNSSLDMKNCKSRRNEGCKGGVISVSTHSTLCIANSVFNSNNASIYGGAVYTVDYVQVNLNNCSFLSNTASRSGGVLFCSKTNICITSSHFSKNNASQVAGGVIGMEANSSLDITESCFDNNFAGWKGGVFSSSDSKLIAINNTQFIENFSALHDGVFRIQFDEFASFANCVFVRNFAIYSRGVGTTKGDSNVVMENCLFENNTADFTGIIVVETESHLVINNGIFIHNSGAKNALLSTDTKAKLFISSSHFLNNTGSRIIYAVGNSNISIENCKIENHFMKGVSIIMLTNSDLSVINSVVLFNSIPSDGGIIVAMHTSNVFVESSVFNHNSVVLGGGVFYLTVYCSLELKNSTFFNNSGGYGAVVFSQHGTVNITNCEFVNCSSSSNGGVIFAQNGTEIVASNNSFLFNKAVFGGCINVETNSSIAIYNTLFGGNSARIGAVLTERFAGNVSMENCTMVRNTADYDAGIYAHGVDKLRLSNGICEQDELICIVYECYHLSSDLGKLYTHNYTIQDNSTVINSMKDKNFLDKALEFGFIKVSAWSRCVSWGESPFASCKFVARSGFPAGVFFQS